MVIRGEMRQNKAFSMHSQARAVYRGSRNDAIVRQFLASRLAHCTAAAAASMTTTVKYMCGETGNFVLSLLFANITQIQI